MEKIWKLNKSIQQTNKTIDTNTMKMVIPHTILIIINNHNRERK